MSNMLDLPLTALGSLLALRFYHRPIFEVGSGRSGTIVLYKALGSHPQIFSMPGENPLITYFADCVEPYQRADQLRYFLHSVRLTQPQLYAELRRLIFESSAGPSAGWKVSVKGVVQHGLKFLGKTHWCVKCFPTKRHADALRELYPQAKFIYIVRNGIEVIHSRSKFPAFCKEPFESHCEFWVDAARKFSYLMSYEAAVPVRHEELLNAPEAVFRRIADTLALRPDPAPASYVQTTLVHSLDDGATHANVDVRKRLKERPPGYLSWTAVQRETFKRICGATMDALGYEVPF
jgi:hypothetical protein